MRVCRKELGYSKLPEDVWALGGWMPERVRGNMEGKTDDFFIRNGRKYKIGRNGRERRVTHVS